MKRLSGHYPEYSPVSLNGDEISISVIGRRSELFSVLFGVLDGLYKELTSHCKAPVQWQVDDNPYEPFPYSKDRPREVARALRKKVRDGYQPEDDVVEITCWAVLPPDLF